MYVCVCVFGCLYDFPIVTMFYCMCSVCIVENSDDPMTAMMDRIKGGNVHLKKVTSSVSHIIITVL